MALVPLNHRPTQMEVFRGLGEEEPLITGAEGGAEDKALRN